MWHPTCTNSVTYHSNLISPLRSSLPRGLTLHNHLDPTTSLPTPTTASLSSLISSSSSAAPHLLLTLTSVLSQLQPSFRKPLPSLPETSDFTIAAFHALSTDQIWSLESHLCDSSQWRSLFGLSYPVFNAVVGKLRPFISTSNLSLPPEYVAALVFSPLKAFPLLTFIPRSLP